MYKSKYWLFDMDISSGKMIKNPRYSKKLSQLSEVIISNIRGLDEKENSLYLNYWTYRLYDDVIVHVLDFMTLSYDLVYTLTLTESDTIYFQPHSFRSNQGDITLIDAVDANGLIHYLNQSMRKNSIQLIFSFLGMNK
ncbi:hypothetical protein [Avibacterium endocarditidis]|uniref:hypothetical protein n=1 Tax=Avibacterium TaxID=292486 RepID=UPI0039FD5743